MAVTLTGFKGGATQTEPAGVDALRQAVSAETRKNVAAKFSANRKRGDQKRNLVPT